MIASILSALSFALMAGAFVIIHLRVTELEKDDTSNRVDNLVKVTKAQNITISEMDKDLDKLEVQSSYNEEAINKIIKQLEDITKDIKRLDEMETRVSKVEKDQSEIRRYYVNYVGSRSLPKYSSESKEKCFDDMDTEEKITVWSNRAELYKDLANKATPLTAPTYVAEYNKCMEEIEKLKNGEEDE